jgi:hypothetical protein
LNGKKNAIFLKSKFTLYLSLGWVSMKDFQATGEASSLQREYPTLQTGNFLHFFLEGTFCVPVS